MTTFAGSGTSTLPLTRCSGQCSVLLHAANVTSAISTLITTLTPTRNLCPNPTLRHTQDVSLRACYLFSRLAKLLRQTLAPFLPDILAALQPLLAAVAADPLPESANIAALARAPSGKGSAAFPGAADDRWGAGLCAHFIHPLILIHCLRVASDIGSLSLARV